MATQNRGTILLGLVEELARLRYGSRKLWPEVWLGDPASEYFPAGSAAIAGFANRLNKIDPMATDGVVVHPNALRNATKIAHIYDALLKAYEKAGWRLVQ